MSKKLIYGTVIILIFIILFSSCKNQAVNQPIGNQETLEVERTRESPKDSCLEAIKEFNKQVEVSKNCNEKNKHWECVFSNAYEVKNNQVIRNSYTDTVNRKELDPIVTKGKEVESFCKDNLDVVWVKENITKLPVCENNKCVIKSMPICDQLRQEFSEKILELNYCNVAADCKIERFDCPFSCFRQINKDADLTKINRIIANYDLNCGFCEYKCPPPPKPEEILCEKNKCIAK